MRLGGRQLVLGAVAHVLDARAPASRTRSGFGVAAVITAGVDAGAAQQLEAVAVEDAEALEGFAVLGK